MKKVKLDGKITSVNQDDDEEGISFNRAYNTPSLQL